MYIDEGFTNETPSDIVAVESFVKAKEMLKFKRKKAIINFFMYMTLLV